MSEYKYIEMADMSIEIQVTNADWLLETGALKVRNTDLSIIVNPDHSFTYDEVIVLMDPANPREA